MAKTEYQKQARENERVLARAVNGKCCAAYGHPFDVIANGFVFEVKTIFSEQYRVTLRKRQVDRKKQWLKENKGHKPYLVVFDLFRKKLYIRKGLKRYPLQRMTETDLSNINRLLK